MRFCSNCGARLDGGAWCGNCGVPVADASPPPAQPIHPATPPGWTAPFDPSGDARPAPLLSKTPDAPLTNPFRGVPASDFVKDGVGVALALTSLLLPWDNSGVLAEFWWALGSVLLLLPAVAVPYVMASRVFRRMTPTHSLWLKILLAFPLLISVALIVLGDLATIGEGLRNVPSQTEEGGIGVAVAVALAGAALIVQPRAVEEGGSSAMQGLWRHAGAGSAVVALAASTIGSALYAITANPGGVEFSLGFLGIVLWAVATPAAGIAFPLYLVIRGNAGGRRVLAIGGWTVLAVAVFWSLRDDPRAIESWRSYTAGTCALGFAAALLGSRAAARRTDPTGVGPTSWVRTARVALLTSAAINAVSLLAHGAVMMHLQSYSTMLSTSALIALCGCVVSGVAGFMLTAIKHRAPVSVSAALVLALGVAAVVLQTQRTGDLVELAALGIAAFITLPLAALAALWIPGAVRSPASSPEGHNDHWASPVSV